MRTELRYAMDLPHTIIIGTHLFYLKGLKWQIAFAAGEKVGQMKEMRILLSYSSRTPLSRHLSTHSDKVIVELREREPVPLFRDLGKTDCLHCPGGN